MMDNAFPWPSLSQPDAFARLSPRVQKAHRYLLRYIQQIQSEALAGVISAMLAPLRNRDRKWLLQENKIVQQNAPGLCERLATPVTYDVWWGAPAAASSSHHCYPGGWLLHTATNLHALEMLLSTAKELRGTDINSDALFAGMILHDCLKPRLLLWQNGELSDNQGEYGHHVAALAEAFLQGASAETLRMLAGVHSGWWQKREGVANFLERTGALLENTELTAIATASPRPDFLPETWIMRQGEAIWYDSTRAAIQEVKTHLDEVVEELLPAEQRQAAQWWVLMHYDELELLRQLADGNERFESSIRKVLLKRDSH